MFNPFSAKGTKHVTDLKLDSLGPGLHKLLLPMAHDGLGRELILPILVLKGKKSGPCLGITAAIHGNEINGIPVIHQLIHRMDEEKLRGTVVALPVVNIPGFLARQRTFEDDQDLNRIMPGKATGNNAEVFAHRFFHKVVTKFDYLVDLHTASTGRINSLYVRADLSHSIAHRMAVLQRPQIILHNKATDRSLRGYAMTKGIPSITVEIGDPHLFQPKMIARALVGIRALMGELKMIPKSKIAIKEIPIMCKSSAWIYTDRGGILRVKPEPADFVEKNSVIATLHNLFGGLIHEYRAPHDGVVIGKSVDPVASTGSRILHLGVLTKDPQACMINGICE